MHAWALGIKPRGHRVRFRSVFALLRLHIIHFAGGLGEAIVGRTGGLSSDYYCLQDMSICLFRVLQDKYYLQTVLMLQRNVTLPDLIAISKETSNYMQLSYAAVSVSPVGCDARGWMKPGRSSPVSTCKMRR